MPILKTLVPEPIHGHGIAVRLVQMSKGVFRLNGGLAVCRLSAATPGSERVAQPRGCPATRCTGANRVYRDYFRLARYSHTIHKKHL
jgi:hypothetical protein